MKVAIQARQLRLNQTKKKDKEKLGTRSTIHLSIADTAMPLTQQQSCSFLSVDNNNNDNNPEREMLAKEREYISNVNFCTGAVFQLPYVVSKCTLASS